MKQLVTLCSTAEIDDPGSRGFEIGEGRKARQLFVVHRDGAFHGYVNSCPHTGVNLEWQEDRFLDMEGAFIQCATHDALFEIDTGLCIAGPCAGDRLTPVELAIEDGLLMARL